MPVKTYNEHSESYVKKTGKSYPFLVEAIHNCDLNQQNKLILSILAEAGVIPSELVSLKPADIDFSKKLLKVRGEITKNKVAREISLSEKVLRLLDDVIDFENEFVLSTRKQGRMNVRSVQRVIVNFSEIYGERVTSVDLRKMFISNSLKNNDIEKVRFESGLKRLDKRKYLSIEGVENLRSLIKEERDLLLFNLLSSGVKSHEIVDLKVCNISKLNISNSLIRDLNKFVSKRQLHRHEAVFLTRQNSHLSVTRIFQIIKKIGDAANVEVKPRILNNSALAAAIFSSDSEAKLNALGVKTRAFHLYGGFVENG